MTASARAHRRRNHYDVTDTVCVADPRTVCTAVQDLLSDNGFCGAAAGPLDAAFQHFAALYSGTLPGWRGCDTPYHDSQHSLDCALACARLIIGHQRAAERAMRLDADQAALTIIVALFHDAGYICRTDDPAATGAVHTLTHVSRSAEILRDLLPRLGFSDQAETMSRIVHFTGYEQPISALQIEHPTLRRMGQIIGTADLMAQTADRCYLEKCRDFLFPEFVACGLAGPPWAEGPTPIYASVAELMRTTIRFNERLWRERLERDFDHAYRLEAACFDGATPYRTAISDNLQRITPLLPDGPFERLNRRPRPVMREGLSDRLRRPPGA